MNKKTLILILAAVVFLAAILCVVLLGGRGSSAETPALSDPSASATDQQAEASLQEPEIPETAITLEGETITVDGPGALVNGSTVTISQAGYYRLSGTLTDGQILVDAGKEDEVRLILNGADITYTKGAPILIAQAGTACIIPEDGTENSVTDTADYVFAPEEDEPDAAIFSKDDLCFDGSGTLTVTGNYDMAVHSKDSVTFCGDGTYHLTAVDDALKGKDEVVISGGTLNVVAGNDGIQTNNDTEKGYLTISGGTVTVDAQGDGLKSENALTISGGTLNVTAQQDGIQVKNTLGGSSLTVSGGDVTILAQQDGMQSDAALTISGGTIDIITGGGSANAPVHTEGFGFPGWFDATTDEETASAKGLKSLTDMTLSGGTIALDCMDDALHCGGVLSVSDTADLTVSTGDDALHTDDTLAISGGKVNILTSYEGLEGVFIDISGGETTLVASDDGLNAAGGSSADTDFAFMGPPGGFGSAETLEDAAYYVNISGGKLHVDAEGDGLDSNGALFISGGEVFVSGPSASMNGGLDYTTTGQITGGTVVVAGISSMVQNFDSSSTQASVLYIFGTNIDAGSLVSLADSTGKVLVETTMAKFFNSVVISHPDLTVGETYTLTCGTETAEVTLTDLITNLGSSGFSGGPGGRMPPPGF